MNWRFWQRPWQVLKELAFVLAAMFVAGVITGSCASIQIPHGSPLLPFCEPSQPIRLMPNWIKQWDTPVIDRRA